MGFRDLPLFNKAMLGKQGWRLLTRPDSLCTRVIKGKYYPHGDFLTATWKKRSSETWWAMLHGQDVLRKGITKRVGPGNSINIWEDNWIPGALKLKPLIRQEHVNVEHVDFTSKKILSMWMSCLSKALGDGMRSWSVTHLFPGMRRRYLISGRGYG